MGSPDSGLQVVRGVAGVLITFGARATGRGVVRIDAPEAPGEAVVDRGGDETALRQRCAEVGHGPLVRAPDERAPVDQD